MDEFDLNLPEGSESPAHKDFLDDWDFLLNDRDDPTEENRRLY